MLLDLLQKEQKSRIVDSISCGSRLKEETKLSWIAGLSKVRADSFILSCRTVLDCQTVRADSSSVSCISSVSINACWEEKARWPVRRREVRLYRTRGSEKKKWRMQRCSMPPQRRSGFTIFLTACGIHRLRILCAPSKRKILLLSLLFLQLCKSSTIIGRREGFCIRQSGFQYWFAILNRHMAF